MGFTVNLGGIMVIVLAIASKVCGFNPAKSNGFLRVIRARSTTSSRGS
jgi:UPF0716 family protein affecting phage T7 exclusion